MTTKVFEPWNTTREPPWNGEKRGSVKTQNPKGGRPPKIGEKRDEVIYVRLTPTEKADVALRARRLDMTPTEYVRSRSLGIEPSRASKAGPDPALISLLNRLTLETARVGNNVNQLARSMHRGSDFQQWSPEIAEEFRALADELKAALHAVASR